MLIMPDAYTELGLAAVARRYGPGPFVGIRLHLGT